MWFLLIFTGKFPIKRKLSPLTEVVYYIKNPFPGNFPFYPKFPFNCFPIIRSTLYCILQGICRGAKVGSPAKKKIFLTLTLLLLFLFLLLFLGHPVRASVCVCVCVSFVKLVVQFANDKADRCWCVANPPSLPPTGRLQRAPFFSFFMPRQRARATTESWLVSLLLSPLFLLPVPK